MIRVESPRDRVNVAKVYEADQKQIFEYWDELSAEERKALLNQVDLIEFRELARLVRTLVNNGHGSESGRLDDLHPVDLIPLDTYGEERNGRDRELDAAVTAGAEALRAGQVGVFLVAGGQGTRLNFEGPKGLYPITPVKQRTLFQVHAEKLLAVQRRYKSSIPWIIMTSDSNHDTTREYFQANNFFGLNAADVTFRRQGMLPVLDHRRGKILMRSKSEIFLSPNGHGGAIAVMQSFRELFQKRGIRYLFYLQVDNPLIHMCDPAFIGYHILRDSQFSSKAVPKEAPEEKMGVFCVAGNRTVVVEYTELGERERSARDPDGRLSFRAGNLANHVISTDFVCPAKGSPAFEMPYHVAHKATPYLRRGELVSAKEPNSIKFESFLFDALPSARNPIVVETSRREYAPVKNFEGENSPVATRRALVEEWAHWLRFAGYDVPRDNHGEVDIPLEIGALFADSPTALKDRLNGQSLEFSDTLLLE